MLGHLPVPYDHPYRAEFECEREQDWELQSGRRLRLLYSENVVRSTVSSRRLTPPQIVLYSLDSAVVNTFKNPNSVQLLYPLSPESALII